MSLRFQRLLLIFLSLIFLTASIFLILTHIRMDTYKIDYCIPDKPKECSYMFTQAVSDEDAAYYGLDWVAIHGYKLKNVTKIKVRGR